MYILVISRGYMTPQNPVLGNFEAEQAWALQHVGHKVVFMSVDRRVRVNYRRKVGLTSFIDKTGMPVYNIHIPLFSPVIKRNPFIPFFLSDFCYRKVMNMLYKRVEKEHGRPDVIYSHYLFNSYMAIDLKIKMKIPMVCVEHWSQLNNDILHPRVKKMGDTVYYSVDKIISVSYATSRRIKQHYNIDSPVIFNMIDTSSFTYVEELPKEFRFVTLGRNTSRKGFDVLIKAFAIANFESNVELYLIGTGDWSDIKELIDSLNMQEQIKIIGPIVEREELVKVMHLCSCFVLPSRKETFSVVCVEALSMGLPVIATPCGGPEEYINDSNGKLVPIDDVDSLAKAMITMKNEYANYSRRDISESIKKVYSPEHIVKRIEPILEKAIKG